MGILFFLFPAWSGRMANAFATSKQYAYELRGQCGNVNKQLATIPACTGD